MTFKNRLNQKESLINTNKILSKDCNRGYPMALIHKILTEVQFSDRTEALCNKKQKAKEILLFVTIYNPATLNRKRFS